MNKETVNFSAHILCLSFFLLICNLIPAQFVPVYREPLSENGLSTLLNASDPAPMDFYNAVPLNNRHLRWSHSGYAVRQTIYIGRQRENVANGKRCDIVGYIDGSKSEYSIPDSLNLRYGTKYYWRVSSDNGSMGKDSGAIWSFRTVDSLKRNDITFFVCSDNHYGRADNSNLNKEIVSLMNMLPGTPLPDEVGGGIVETPRGVVVNGDILDEPNNKIGEKNWNDFVGDFGLTGEDGKLGFPVYEGYGNHDVEGRRGPSTPLGGFSKAGIIERNKRRVGVTNVSANGMHYSWDWDDLHLVQLNLFGGKDTNDVINVAKAPHDPGNAIAFLKEDLEKNVGKSNRKVIIFQHFGWIGGMSNWWSDKAKDAFFEVVKRYNIVALINGHSHGAEFIPWKNLLTIHDGATARPESGGGDFMVVRIIGNKLIVVQKKKNGWGIMMEKQL